MKYTSETIFLFYLLFYFVATHIILFCYIDFINLKLYGLLKSDSARISNHSTLRYINARIERKEESRIN